MAELEQWTEKLIQNSGQSQCETTIKDSVVGVSSSKGVCDNNLCRVARVCDISLAVDGAHRCLYAVLVRGERCLPRGAERRRAGASAGVRDRLNLCYDTTHYTPEPLFI